MKFFSKPQNKVVEKIFFKANVKFTPQKSLKKALSRKLIPAKSLVKLNSRKLMPAKSSVKHNSQKLTPAKYPKKNLRKFLPLRSNSEKVFLARGRLKAHFFV